MEKWQHGLSSFMGNETLVSPFLKFEGRSREDDITIPQDGSSPGLLFK